MFISLFRPQLREQNHLANISGAGGQHDQPIQADTHAAGRRHSILERTQVVLVDRTCLGVAGFLGGLLVFEAGALLVPGLSALHALAAILVGTLVGNLLLSLAGVAVHGGLRLRYAMARRNAPATEQAAAEGDAP